MGLKVYTHDKANWFLGLYPKKVHNTLCTILSYSDMNNSID